MRITVVRAGALGDTLLALPAVRALRARYPNAHITAAGYTHFWALAGDLVDGIVSIEHPHLAPLLGGAPTSNIPDTDLLVAWTSRRPTVPAGSATRIIHASPYPPPGIHAADWLASSLEPLTGLAPPLPLELGRLHPPAPSSIPARPRAFLHPGAGATWKRWPADRFTSLGRFLLRSGYDVWLIEGPADGAAVAAVQQYAQEPFPVLCEPDLAELASVLASGSLFIGNDSGVTHLAAAVGLPTVALFGPTDPASWAPRGNVAVVRRCRTRAQHQGHIRVCQEDGCMDRIEVEDVLAAVEALGVENPVENGLQPC